MMCAVNSYSKADELRYLRQENGWLKHHHRYDRSTMFRQDELLRNTEGRVGTRDRPVGPEPTRLRFDLESAHKERPHRQPAHEGRPATFGSLTYAEVSLCGAHGLEGGRPSWAHHENVNRNMGEMDAIRQREFPAARPSESLRHSPRLPPASPGTGQTLPYQK